MPYTFYCWVFNEDSLRVTLVEATECGDITTQEADLILRFLKSAHAARNKLVVRQTMRLPEEL